MERDTQRSMTKYYPRTIVLVSMFFVFFFMRSPSLTSQDISLKADEYIQAHVGMNQFSGSVLIAKDGQIILKKGYGFANYEHDVSNDAQTKFCLASLTKQFTAMAVMQLCEAGLLNVDDPINKHIPEYPNGDKITIHHLLSHTSGIPNFTASVDEETRVKPCSLEEIIERFKDEPLEFTPGEKFRYCNAGYYLLGYVIEKVTGASYESVLKRQIFDPLGMANSGYDRHSSILKKRASGYSLRDSKLVNADYVCVANTHASGALYSTVEDLFLWDRVLYTEKLLKKKSLELMFTPFTDQYGYGWGIVQVFDRKFVGHNGDMEGFQTHISRFIDDDVCVIVLSNYGHAPIGKIGVDLAAIVFGESYTIPRQRVAVYVDPEVYNAYVGQYAVSPKFTLTIIKEDDRLYCQPTGQERLEIVPESESTFFLREVDAQILFVKDEDGKVGKLILHQSGRDIPAKKVE